MRATESSRSSGIGTDPIEQARFREAHLRIADGSVGTHLSLSIVGGSAGIATGAAQSAKMRGTDQVVVCFFGEGALGQGLVYEVMNMASLWKLPVVYLCENNQYNEYTHYSETTAGDIVARASAFGIPGEEVDGQDVLAVSEVLRRAVARGRSGGGPSFVVANTYRFHGHHVGDVDRAYYRSKEEEADWKTNRDPITRLGARLVDCGLADPAELEDIASAAQEEIAAGVRYALDAPFPAESEVTEDVYA